MAESDTAADAPYRVLARKYRPKTFDDLIGQEAMTRTLANAFERGRIAQAYLLTGVRGVGKTTTARIIARALNCIGPDGTGGPTIAPCGQCAHCRDIMEDRDVDVLEMDAASNNSVDNIREINDAVRYRPAAARYKVYILDEAHMLSNAAFNALLKTLEEPPPHVKFIFATTEARRLPVTVLSRCQRFDLRRVSPADLAAHYGRVAEAEGVSIEDEALAIVARAADGSVRDGLSLLDQAIALAEPGQPVTAEATREMLGLADRLASYDLFEAAMAGDAPKMLDLFGGMIAAGADPAAVLNDLMEATSWTTRLAVDPTGADFAGSSAAERDRAAGLAKGLGVAALTRAWQILNKGQAETQMAASPRLSAEMTLVRLAYASTLPTPDDLIRKLEAGGPASGAAGGAPAPGGGGAPRTTLATAPAAARAVQAEMVASPAVLPSKPPPKPQPTLDTLDALVAFLNAKGAPMALSLVRRLRPVEFGVGRIVYEDDAALPPNYRKRLREELGKATDMVWVVEAVETKGAPSQADAEAAADAAVRAHPLVQAALAAFPDAELKIGRPAAEPEPETDRAPGPVDEDNPDVVYDDDFHFGDWEPDD